MAGRIHCSLFFVLLLLGCTLPKGTSVPKVAPSGARVVSVPGAVVSARPGATLAPAPIVSTMASPVTVLAPEQLKRRQQLSDRLGAIARVSFEQRRASMLGDGKFSTQSLISNNAGGLISNNAGGLITNNAGGLISNNAGGYRLAAVDTAIALTPKTGEILGERRNWIDGGHMLVFERPEENEADRRYWRFVHVDQADVPFEQFINTVSGFHPNGRQTAMRTEQLTLSETGGLREFFTHSSESDDTGVELRFQFGPEPSQLRYPELGVDLDITDLHYDYVTQKGRFAIRFNQTGWVESGQFENLMHDEFGIAIFSHSDPLRYAFKGNSTVKDAQGEVMFTRHYEVGEITGSWRDIERLRVRKFDLGNDFTMVIQDREGKLQGDVLDGLKVVGQVTMTIASDGTTTFYLRFADDPENVQRIGYGNAQPQDVPKPSPTPRSTWAVKMLNKVLTEQDAKGAIQPAKIGRIFAMVASKKQPDRFFATDSDRHLILRIDHIDNKWQVKTLAGTGEAGATDGPGLTAQFDKPWGLTNDADDTLYVSEPEQQRIRRVRLSDAGVATVDTIAGTSTKGFADGPGLTARFNLPFRLVALGRKLYLADMNNARLRMIDLDSPTFTVSTVAGSSRQGEADGVGTAAQFYLPQALAAENETTLLIGDWHTGALRRFNTLTKTVTTVVRSVPEKDRWLDGSTTSSGFAPFQSITVTPKHGIWVGNTAIRAVTDAGQIVTVVGRKNQEVRDGDEHHAKFSTVRDFVPLANGHWLVPDANTLRELIPPAQTP